jgi:cytidylate kinase
MTKKNLSSYMVNKLHETHTILNTNDKIKRHPFVTISREYGCNASQLSKNLSKALSSYKTANGSHLQWKAVDHQILASAAKHIGIDHSIVDEITYQNINDYFVSFLNISFSKYNRPSTVTVRNSIAKIILKFAEEGHVVLLGRGGVTITGPLPHALHIRLVAPTSWRAQQVMRREHISLEKAKKLIRKIDHIRNEMRDFYGKENDTLTTFDIIFNVMRVSEKEIIESITSILLQRGAIIQ